MVAYFQQYDTGVPKKTGMKKCLMSQNCHYLQVTLKNHQIQHPNKNWGGGGGLEGQIKQKKDFLKIHPIYVENVVYFDDILI